jgi:hypothetical protein
MRANQSSWHGEPAQGWLRTKPRKTIVSPRPTSLICRLYSALPIFRCCHRVLHWIILRRSQFLPGGNSDFLMYWCMRRSDEWLLRRSLRWLLSKLTDQRSFLTDPVLREIPVNGVTREVESRLGPRTFSAVCFSERTLDL